MKHTDESLHQLDIPDERRLPPARRAALKDDVLRRIRGGEPEHGTAPRRDRSRRLTRRLLPALVALVVGVACGAVTTALATAEPGAPRADAQSLSTVSTRGRAVPLTPRSERFLDFSRSGPGVPQSKEQALLVAERGPTVFFRVPLRDGGACFAVGRAAGGGEAYDIGTLKCWAPAPRFPLLDMSPVQADGPGGFQVLQIHGFAADGVDKVAVTDLNGEVVAEAAVSDNVYKITAYPPGRVSALIALDEGEHVLQRISYTR